MGAINSLPGDGRAFWAAKPYPHIAIDDFFEPRFFRALAKSMRDVADLERATFITKTDIERNKWCFSPDVFDENLHRAAAELSGPHFVGFLERLLEVSGLIPLTALKQLSSRSYFHVSTKGGAVGSHVDQSYVTQRYLGKVGLAPKYVHVASVVFYGSEHWEPSYGGHTVLYDQVGRKAVTAVECKPNRTNVFLHTSTSFHGVSETTTTERRYSMYMDYYLRPGDLPKLREAIVRNKAHGGARYWPHDVTFIPDDSHDPIHKRVYEKVYANYRAAEAKAL